jgi:hypothetical protein
MSNFLRTFSRGTDLAAESSVMSSAETPGGVGKWLATIYAPTLFVTVSSSLPIARSTCRRKAGSPETRHTELQLITGHSQKTPIQIYQHIAVDRQLAERYQAAMKEVGVTFLRTQKIFSKNLGIGSIGWVPFRDNACGFFVGGAFGFVSPDRHAAPWQSKDNTPTGFPEEPGITFAAAAFRIAR